LPNTGLVTAAICLSLTKNNMETEFRDFRNIENPRNYLCRLIYAYSTLGLPVILGMTVPENAKFYRHAVAICGHRISPFVRSQQHQNFISKADFLIKKSLARLSSRHLSI
jgi:hypothetical protein